MEYLGDGSNMSASYDNKEIAMSAALQVRNDDKHIGIPKLSFCTVGHNAGVQTSNSQWPKWPCKA